MYRRILNKLRYPQAHIAPHTHIAANTTLGAHTIIHPQARLAGSALGPHCTIYPHTEIYGTTLEHHNAIHPRTQLTDCHIGAHTYIARETYLNKVRIGRFSSIGPRVLAGTGEHPSNLVTTSPEFYSTLRQTGHTYKKNNTTPDNAERQLITIGNDVWIGAHVFIRDGVTIGDGTIIAAGAIVTKNVPPYHIYGGVPAKQIRPRYTSEITERLLALAWWNWTEERLAAAQPYLAATDPEHLLSWAENRQTASTP